MTRAEDGLPHPKRALSTRPESLAKNHGYSKRIRRRRSRPEGDDGRLHLYIETRRSPAKHP
jgi:hypothetical protein